MGNHAKLSPSQAHRWMRCPGSVRMEAGYPDSDNPYSQRGTAAHQVAEWALKQGQHPGRWVGEEIPVNGGVVVFTPEDAEAVAIYTNYVWRRREEMQDAEMHVETKVTPGAWMSRDDIWGTVDCLLVGPLGQEVEVIDYKHGSGHMVPILGNPQLELYGIGGTGIRVGLDSDVPVKLTIVQPRCPHVEGPIRSTTFTARELGAKVPVYQAAAEATDDPNAPLVPGDEQCRFCRARHACPALNQDVMEIFSPVEGQQVDWVQAEKVVSQPVDTLSLEHMVRAMDAEKLVQAWFKAIREELTSRAMDGTTIPGHKLVSSITRRKWSLDDSKITDKLARMRTPEGKSIGIAGATIRKPLSPSQAEKELKPKVTENIWRKIEELIVKPEGQPTLVPESDPRESIEQAEVFKPIEQEKETWLQILS